MHVGSHRAMTVTLHVSRLVTLLDAADTFFLRADVVTLEHHARVVRVGSNGIRGGQFVRAARIDVLKAVLGVRIGVLGAR